MLLVFLGIAIIASIVLFVVGNHSFNEEGFYVGGTLSVMIAIGTIVAIGIIAPKVATEEIYNEKIAMYQEENQRIEEQIDTVVKQYMKHEKETFEDVKTEDSAITLVTLFPELKSDELVSQQINIYVANNEKIKQLKEEKINIAKEKWLLYFGK